MAYLIYLEDDNTTETYYYLTELHENDKSTNAVKLAFNQAESILLYQE